MDDDNPTPDSPLRRAPRIAIFEDSATAMNRYMEEVFHGHPTELLFMPSSLLPPDDVNRLQDFNPDLIIIDLLMGESRADGYELLGALRAHPSFCGKPMVVCSKLITPTDAGERERQRVLQAGATAAFGKLDRYPAYGDLSVYLTQTS